MKYSYKIIILFFGLIIFSSCANYVKPDKDIIYQTGPFEDLLAGQYKGFIKYSEINKYGDFGIGTIDGLNGEGIEISSRKYVINGFGVAIKVKNKTSTPFAMKTYFEPDTKYTIKEELDYTGLKEYLDGVLGNKNILYAIKITGKFKYMKTRSMHKQTEPFLPLLEALEDQEIFEIEECKGIMAGFYIPEKLNKLNLPGYHFHFLKDDNSTGGHILDLIIEEASIELDESKTIELI